MMTDVHGGMSRSNGPNLHDFLMEAELQQYYPGIRGDLKVQTTAQLKYVTEEDLNAIGMSKPEMRRLKKYFQKHFPQTYLSKFKKLLLPKREEQSPGVLSMLPEERQDKPSVRVPNKHMIPADAIIVNKELGTGEFGVVQQGVWTNDGERIQVAIKCLSRERMQNNPIEFLKEAAIMHAIDHEHIVRLYGVVLDTDSLMLVTELAPLRSLLECLKEPSLRASFPVLSLCDFTIQIVDGMQYLEAKRLIHRDLAARNILVFSKNKVKISDFGLSRALGVGKDYYQTNFNVNLKLPIAWCAPECISYLKFTSASDVWAYGVTLYEMFSYGFQPWAALTGHQILEAIDEPNFQRLEQPECCPKDYFTLMQQCWQHEPSKRPKFSELINLLPDLKPEQVQAVQDSIEPGQLVYRQSDIITVLDKGNGNTLWKGVLNNGKTGFFNPAHTIAYLGSNLPSNKPGEFTRGDGKNAFSSQRRKIRTDMISSPQGDLKHTGHVGLDGAYFGDISFLGGKYPNLPRQVVTPYKPQEDATDNCSQISNQDTRSVDTNRESGRECRGVQQDAQNKHDSLWPDMNSEVCHVITGSNVSKRTMTSNVGSNADNLGADHEYHEISDEENQDSPLRFDKTLNFDFGPSLLAEMDQMFRSLGSSPPPPPPGHPLSTEHESSNARNELREMQAKQCNKKKATVSPINVKPISAADQKTLYSAIAMAQELTARSMTDLEHPPESPRTPASPSRRRKFSFKLPHQHSPKPDRRHFSEEAASIPDIQATLSAEAKEVYNSLVETPTLESTGDTNPLRMLRSGLPIVRSRIRGNKHATLGYPMSQSEDASGEHGHFEIYHSGARTLPKVRAPSPHASLSLPQSRILERHHSLEIENNQNQSNIDENPIPLPPRDRSKTLQPKSSLPRHQRKHPLIIPGGGVTRTLAKMAATTPCIEDQVDGHFMLQNSNAAVPGTSLQDNYLPEASANSPEEFEQRIDSELAALDSLPIEENQLRRCSVISEDLLEFSDNLIDCGDMPDLCQNVSETSNDGQSNSSLNMTDDLYRKISTESKYSLRNFVSKIQENVEVDLSQNQTLISSYRSEDWNKTNPLITTTQLIKTQIPSARVQQTPLNYSSQTNMEEISSKSEVFQREKPLVHISTSDNFHSTSPPKVYHLSNEKALNCKVASDLSRQSDHVSCEDLLEFACDGPNTRRTRGPHNGEQSDEVRIMLKVLHEQSTPESCIAALNVTEWDVLAAIKLERLQSLLKKENNFVGLEDCKWLCSSLQSLSSTVSSIESLGAPSTLKLPLWDKASAEFCFAKSRELLTKPNAWTSYMDIDLNTRILDNAAMRQNLIKSSEFLENGNRKDHLNYEGTSYVDANLSVRHQDGKKFNVENSNYDFPREKKRVSTSYVERYFEQPKYCDDETTILGCTSDKIYFGEEKLDKYDKINNLEQLNKSTYYSNIQEQSPSIGARSNQTSQSKLSNYELKDCNSMHFEGRFDENFDILKKKATNFESSRNQSDKFDVVNDKAMNLDLGTRPKIPAVFTESTKINFANFTKKVDMSKSRTAKMSFVPRKSNQDMNSIYGSSDSIKTNVKIGNSPRSNNIEAVKINIQSFRKIEQNQNDHDGFPFVISNNPIFIAETEKKESPIYSSSESLRVNFQRLRRKSDAEASQVEFNSKLLAEKYQREISGLESVKNYLDSKKGQSLNFGLGKLTQNMIQLGKNIAQNSRNLETTLPKSLVSNIKNLDLSASSQTSLRNLNIPIQKPKHLGLNIPMQHQSPTNIKLNLIQKPNPTSTSPTLHQQILEPPKLYQNDQNELPKLNIAEKFSGAAIYRHRTSSLSESRKPLIKNLRRSFHPRNDSSEDSDSISHSETDIRSRLRYKRKHKRVPHNLRLTFKNKTSFLHPDSSKGLSAVELCGKSPPPSTSFLNSLSPPFSSRNNLLSWPESAASSSLTFTSNSDIESDTSSECPEFINDTLTFPPSPAP